jgi:hypothetical protein
MSARRRRCRWAWNARAAASVTGMWWRSASIPSAWWIEAESVTLSRSGARYCPARCSSTPSAASRRAMRRLAGGREPGVAWNNVSAPSTIVCCRNGIVWTARCPAAFTRAANRGQRMSVDRSATVWGSPAQVGIPRRARPQAAQFLQSGREHHQARCLVRIAEEDGGSPDVRQRGAVSGQGAQVTCEVEPARHAPDELEKRVGHQPSGLEPAAEGMEEAGVHDGRDRLVEPSENRPEMGSSGVVVDCRRGSALVETWWPVCFP